MNQQESSEVEKLMVWKVQSKQVYYSAFNSVQFDSHTDFIDSSLELQTCAAKNAFLVVKISD